MEQPQHDALTTDSSCVLISKHTMQIGGGADGTDGDKEEEEDEEEEEKDDTFFFVLFLFLPFVFFFILIFVDGVVFCFFFEEARCFFDEEEEEEEEEDNFWPFSFLEDLQDAFLLPNVLVDRDDGILLETFFVSSTPLHL